MEEEIEEIEETLEESLLRKPNNFKCYKICRLKSNKDAAGHYQVDLTQYVSYAYETLGDELSLEYKLFEPTFPKIGKIFVFKSLWWALREIKLFNIQDVCVLIIFLLLIIQMCLALDVFLQIKNL